MNFPDRREALARVNRYFEQSQALFDETPYRRRNDPVSFESKITLEEQSVLLNILMPAHDRSSEMAWRIVATRRAIQTILVLRVYQKGKGIFPAKLQDLVDANYLENLPDDPYSVLPLAYGRRGEDFVLYSLAADFDDDGGMQNSDNSWGEKHKGGDRLFWPVR